MFNFTANAQTLPVYIDERGDTITYDWPIPLDSLCIKNEIIIRFKSNALYLEELCQQEYNFPIALNPTNFYKEIFMSKKFPVQQLIADPTLLAAIQSYGGDTLTRITAADPCHDTLSITRYGDTVKVENYLWMKLHLNNDTSIVNACIDLMVFYRQFIELAEPNYCGGFNGIPSDNFYATKQNGLHSRFTNTERAWDFQTGNYNVKVGIIDTGIDFDHFDLGDNDLGNNLKIVDGWNYSSSNFDIDISSKHGTMVAGIVGATTNGSYFGLNTGIAGIAGGWKENPQDPWTKGNIGSPLFGFKVDVVPEDWPTVSNVIGAIYDAASDFGDLENENQIRSGFGVYVLNCSWGYDNDFKYLVNLRRAVNYAYEQGVSVVASRNNAGGNELWHPACFADNWVTSVGAYDYYPYDDNYIQKFLNSSYGRGMDILAPGSKNLVYTTHPNNNFSDINQTSAAAPHVSGALALLISENFDIDLEINGKSPEPQDYENILKASAIDLIYESYGLEPPVVAGYDSLTAWGGLNIGKAFNMINDGYRLKHITVDIDNIEPFTGDLSEFTFYNEAGYDLSNYNGLIPGDDYQARKREVTATYTLKQGWIQNEITPLFVWGRHGNRKKGNDKVFHGGLSPATLNFMTPFTDVTSGEKGNQIVSGIYHNNSSIVHLKTYQFEVFKSDGTTKITNLPKDDELAMHFTVYGVNTTSVEENLQNNPKSIFIYPNPSQDQIFIKFNSINACSPILKIINSFGFPVLEKHFGYVSSGISEKNIDVSNLPTGTYFIELRCGNTIKSDKFVISR